MEVNVGDLIVCKPMPNEIGYIIRKYTALNGQEYVMIQWINHGNEETSYQYVLEKIISKTLIHYPRLFV